VSSPLALFSHPATNYQSGCGATGQIDTGDRCYFLRTPPLTSSPTAAPTIATTQAPTANPTFSPTAVPTTPAPTYHPCQDGSHTCDVTTTECSDVLTNGSPVISDGTGNRYTCPCVLPTYPLRMSRTSCGSSAPTHAPTNSPTAQPTATPTAIPTSNPTARPTRQPTADPTAAPTLFPCDVGGENWCDPVTTVCSHDLSLGLVLTGCRGLCR
jgi:hypothetical protein